MTFFSNLRIGTKLWVAVGILITALALLIGYAAVRAGAVQKFSDATLGLAETKTRLATRWAGLTEAAVGRVLVNVVSTDKQVSALLDEQNKKAIAEISSLQKQLKELPQTAKEEAVTQRIAQARVPVLALSTNVTKLRDAGDAAGAAAELEKFKAAVVPYVAALTDYVKLQEEQVEEARTLVAADRQFTLTVATAVVVLIVLGMIVGTQLLIRSIRNPVMEAVSLADRIAAGDLSHQREEKRGDEMGQLLRALLAMSAALSRTVGDVRQAATTIGTASSEIASGNTDLSQRTEEQAANLQQTAASMEQISSTVKHNADTAREATELADAASTAAGRGGEAVGEVVQTMEAISASSRKIADIIGVIDGIAFQTNILALNAAVEAARAGEQGRGFAVVASEVRSLAQRSADAARQIKELINDSVGKVQAGSDQVDRAGRTMDDIVSQVKRVTQLISQIGTATAEQTQGIGQVSEAVSQLDQVTQQNAALVEQSAAAAENLNRQAGRLVDAVGVFTLAPARA